MFLGSCAGLLAIHTLWTVAHEVKQGVPDLAAMTHTQLSAGPSVSVHFHFHSPWLSAGFGVRYSGPSMKYSVSSGLSFLPKVSQIKSNYVYVSMYQYTHHRHDGHAVHMQIWLCRPKNAYTVTDNIKFFINRT